MRTPSPTVRLALGVALVASLAACSSEGEDAPPSTDTPISVVEVVPDSVVDGEAATTDPVTSSAIGSIDGPASVDPDFTGANPGGDEGGG